MDPLDAQYLVSLYRHSLFLVGSALITVRNIYFHPQMRRGIYVSLLGINFMVLLVVGISILITKTPTVSSGDVMYATCYC